MPIRIRKLKQNIKSIVQRRHSGMARRIIDRDGENGGLAVAVANNVDLDTPVGMTEGRFSR